MKDYAKGYAIAIIVLMPILYMIDSSLFFVNNSIAIYSIAMFTVLSVLLYYFLSPEEDLTMYLKHLLLSLLSDSY